MSFSFEADSVLKCHNIRAYVHFLGFFFFFCDNSCLIPVYVSKFFIYFCGSEYILKGG